MFSSNKIQIHQHFETAWSIDKNQIQIDFRLIYTFNSTTSDTLKSFGFGLVHAFDMLADGRIIITFLTYLKRDCG